MDAHPTRRPLTPWQNLCPACRQAPVFRGLIMNESCPGCGIPFYRESGYFLGAMVLSYFASSGLGILLLLVLFAGFKLDIVEAAVWSVLWVACLTPLLYRVSRLAWIHLDRTADPGIKK
jgi:hypothetical protein